MATSDATKKQLTNTDTTPPLTSPASKAVTLTTTSRVLESSGEEDNAFFSGDEGDIKASTVPLRSPVGDQGQFWKDPEFPEKYPLDHVNVENLVNMLSKIHLVWPEDLPHYDELEFSMDPDRSKFPQSYWHNSDKEKVVLWHAENFRRQFINKFPDRRPPVIAPRNECGCQKLISTYITPTSLGYPEFLDCITTVEFLKDFFAPDILNPPTKFPDRIRSHSTCIKKRKINAHELAIIIVSILNGSGYNSYVVDGFASKTLCTIDTTGDYVEPEEVPFLDYQVEDVEKEKAAEEGKNKSFHVFGDFDFSFLGFDKEEEETAPQVSPSKYRFKRKAQEGEGGEDAGATVTEDNSGSPAESQVRVSLHPGAPTAPAQADTRKSIQVTASDAAGGEGEGTPSQAMMMEGGAGEGVEGEEGEGEGEDEDEEVIDILDEEEDEEEEDEGEEEEIIPVEEEVFEELDPSITSERYHGRRTHAWVLVLPGGLRDDIDEPFFLEPFSGSYRPLKDPNFLSIEAVFNEKNYWINIQPPVKNVKLLKYDLDNPAYWSKLLVPGGREKKKRGQNNAQQGSALFQDDDEEDASQKPGELVLTMPVSWTVELDISQEDYDRKYPDGSKTIEYNDAIVEVAAPYANPDGLVRKVLKFNGPSRDPEDLLYIEEKFMHRKDKLVRRMWYREGKLLHEFFAKGRKDALKEHIHVSGRNRPDYPRDLFYYSNAHPRGVYHRHIIKKGMIEHFEDRDDKLYYKMTLFGSIICSTLLTKEEKTKGKAREIMDLVKGIGGGGSNARHPRRKIIKILEKFHRNEEKDSKEDIAEKHFLIDEGRLKVIFHYEKGWFTRNILDFYKMVKPGQSKYAPVEFKPEDCVEYQANREAEKMDVYKKFCLLQQMDRDERASSILSREAEDEVYQTVTSRVQEDWRHEVEPDAYAGDRNEEYLKGKGGEDDYEDMDVTGADFTTPFFEKYGVPKTKREEILMKKRIMLHEKVKIMRRAYMIKELYERESGTLHEKMEWYHSHIEQLNSNQEEDFYHMYKAKLFQMHILEQRMVRHQQETPRMYYNLLVELLRHPQLNRFTNRKDPPPPPPPKGLTDEERQRIAKELAKLKDCCQFYNIRFSEKKQKKKRVEEVPEEEMNEVEVRRQKCREHRDRIKMIETVHKELDEKEAEGGMDEITMTEESTTQPTTAPPPGETEVAKI